MASLDFVYDLVKRFEDDHIDYLVVAIREGKAKNKADVLFKLKDNEAASVLVSVLAQVQKDLKKKLK